MVHFVLRVFNDNENNDKAAGGFKEGVKSITVQLALGPL